MAMYYQTIFEIADLEDRRRPRECRIVGGYVIVITVVVFATSPE